MTITTKLVAVAHADGEWSILHLSKISGEYTLIVKTADPKRIAQVFSHDFKRPVELDTVDTYNHHRVYCIGPDDLIRRTLTI